MTNNALNWTKEECEELDMLINSDSQMFKIKTYQNNALQDNWVECFFKGMILVPATLREILNAFI